MPCLIFALKAMSLMKLFKEASNMGILILLTLLRRLLDLLESFLSHDDSNLPTIPFLIQIIYLYF